MSLRIRDLGEVDILGSEHSPQLLKGQHEVHLAADAAAAGLQLLGGAGANKGDLAVGVLPLLESGRQHHGGHGHGDVRRKAGELLLGHDGPCRAAGGCHKGLSGGDVLHELLRLLHGAEVGAHRHLLQSFEAQLLHGGEDLSGSDLFTKLAPEGRGDDGDDLLPLLDGVDQLEDLALVHNGSEGAVHQTLAAVDALIVVDVRPAILVLADGVHAAGLLTGPQELDDGLIGAGLLAAAALDAFGLIDAGPAMLQLDGALGAGLIAVLGQAPLTGLRHLVVGVRAGVTGVLDDVDQRWIVVFFGDGASLHAVGDHVLLRHVPQRQTHGQPDALTNDGPLQKNGFPIGPHLTGDDLIGQLLHAGAVVPTLISQLCHSSKDLLTQRLHVAVQISHVFPR